MQITPGSYKARAIAPAEFGKSSQKETPGVAVSLRLEDGPHKGAVLVWRAYLSEGAKPRTVEGLVLMGFDGDDPASVQKNEVIAVVDNETGTYQGEDGQTKTYTESRIKWINDPNRQGGAKFLPLSDQERAIIQGDIKAAIAATKAAQPKSDPLEFPPSNGPRPKF